LGYHIVNVLLHAANAVLLWRVLGRLKVPAGWLAALIFAVHPLCVASVAWIAETKNTLSLLFYLLSILWYLRCSTAFRSSDFGPRSSTWYWLSLGAFVLALLSKTSTVMLPVVLLGCAWWQRGRLEWRDWLRTAPFFALALAFGLMSVIFQARGATAGTVVQSENFWGRLAGAGMALWFYLGKALWPLHLNMIYPRWRIAAAAPLWYLPLLMWCALLGACWGFRRGWGRHALFGLGCFTVALFPVLGFFDMFFLTMSRVSDHFVYLPLTTLVALAAAGLAYRLKGRLLGAAGAGLVLGLAVLTTMRAQVFLNEEALWRDTLAKNPTSWCAQANLGWILATQKKYEEARELLVASLASKPDNAQAHCNLGRILALQGKTAEGDQELQEAVRLKPKDAEIRRSYAAALAEQGKPEEAVKQLQDLLHLKPDTAARLQLATLLRESGSFQEAAVQYRRVLAVKPENIEALNNLAWMLASCSDSAVRNGTDAVRFAERACRLTGFKQAQMVAALGAAYAEAGRFPAAMAAAQKAIELAAAEGNTQFAAINERLLRLYRAGKPFRMPPPASRRPGAEPPVGDAKAGAR